MSSTPREIGTLIVVILKAKHLPNKRHIGKQDPYCCVSVNGEKRRTKAIKRGGQHPEWDEEVRFTLLEDVEDELERTARGDGTPPPPPPKDDKAPKKIRGGKLMRLSCFADDPREPDLIGETDVDLTEVLTKGETDEWFTLMNKEKFSGQVYLELTFWSNEPAPEKKVTPKPPKTNKQYGGPGSFIASGEIPSSLGTGLGSQSSRITSTSSLYEHSRRDSDSVPSSLRASNSLAKLDLYVPPYEQRRHQSPIDRITNDFGELGVSDHHRRRESFPPPHGGYTPRPSSSIGFSTLPSHPPHGYEQSMSDTASTFSYDRPLTPPDSLHHQNNIPASHSNYQVQPVYQPQYDLGTQYDAGLPQSAYPHQSPTRGPRYSIPASSSGFIPLQSSSGFVSSPSHPSDPLGFAPPPSHTPAPIVYNQSHFNPQSGFGPVPSQTSVPSSFSPPLPPSSSASFHPHQSFPPSQSFQYPQYAPPPSVSAPPQQFIPHQPPPTIPPQSQTTSSQPYQGYPTTPSPPHDYNAPSQNTSLSSSFGTGSRPLPQQPQSYGQQQVQPSFSLPPSSSSQQVASYSPTQPGSIMFPPANAYQAVPPPPPPPPPPIQANPAPQLYTTNGHQPSVSPAGPLVPPPPPPPSQYHSNPPSRRRSSLPQPPINYQPQQPPYQPVPPPPPPPPLQHHQLPPPPPPPPSHISDQNQPSYPGPPPKPPVQLNDQRQWFTHNTQQQFQGNYA